LHLSLPYFLIAPLHKRTAVSLCGKQICNITQQAKQKQKQNKTSHETKKKQSGTMAPLSQDALPENSHIVQPAFLERHSNKVRRVVSCGVVLCDCG
jgi:hypothetical protein